MTEKLTEEKMKQRTKQFGIRVLSLVEALPKTVVGRIIADQLGRCGTSVGANYRAACRGRSKAEFISKLGIVEEEADESAYWMEIIIEKDLLAAELVEPLLREANELTAIVTSSRKTARRNAPPPNRKSPIANPK